jgi:nucleolar protein 58
MLVLVESYAGYALFKVMDKAKLENVDDSHKFFETPEAAQTVVKLNHFAKFADTTASLNAAVAQCDSMLDPQLKQFLQDNVVTKDVKAKLAVSESKLGSLIKEELGLKCVYDETVLELMRGIRSQMDNLLGISPADRNAMRLGLSHSLCRYKLKFSPDKVDTMIIQAISLLDELDKELNTYAMRVREWYGWHFPEMGKIVTDNALYAKTVRKMGVRTHAATMDLSDVLPEDMEKELKEAAEVSMGTEIADEDIDNIQHLADQVINISEYRTALYEYLKNRMAAIAPNLTEIVCSGDRQ